MKIEIQILIVLVLLVILELVFHFASLSGMVSSNTYLKIFYSLLIWRYLIYLAVIILIVGIHMIVAYLKEKNVNFDL